MGHTWYIQYWMSKIYDNAPQVIDIRVVNEVLDGILREEYDNFFTFLQLLTPAQKKVVRGIAKARSIQTPITSAQLAALNMGTPSTARSCIKALIDKEILLE